MRQKLEEYERSDEIDEWNLHFVVGQDYTNMSLEEIQEKHKR